MLHFHVTKAVTRPPKPKTRVKGASRARRTEALARRMSRAVAADLENGLATFKRRVRAEDLRACWEAGQYEQVDRYIPWDKLDDDLSPTARKLDRTLFEGGKEGFRQLPPPAAHMRWDMGNPRIRQYVARRTGELVQGIKDDVREHVRDLVARSFTEALTPGDVAREIKGSIGLHKRYRLAVRNYRKRLVEEGKPKGQVEKLSLRYEQRLLKSRAMTVARTESHRAANQGQRSVWREAAAQGYIDRSTARRVWVVDGNPCDICEPLDGTETTLDEPYPGGYEPGEVHPQCMCIEILEID